MSVIISQNARLYYNVHGGPWIDLGVGPVNIDLTIPPSAVMLDYLAGFRETSTFTWTGRRFPRPYSKSQRKALGHPGH